MSQQPTQPHALIIGESLIDIIDTEAGHTKEHPGGSPMNVAIGLARLARPVHLATSYALDTRGKQLHTHLADEHITITPGSNTAARTSTAHATIDATGSATYQFDVHWDRPPINITNNTCIVHAGSFSAITEPGATHVREAIAAARATATITYDPNARPSLMGTPRHAYTHMERLIGMADIVKVSDEDIHWLTGGTTDPLNVAENWLRHGPSLVVVTRGAKGAVALTRNGVAIAVETPTVNVVDTVGAGDSFMAALIDSLWTHDLLGAHRRSDLANIDQNTLTTIIQRCSRISGITVSRAGANPPTIQELT
ncbi:carbohydrate kinase family protein [Dermatophilus congolensis]|uniref:5-dehydro-2-deoxygluconokinase n=1 Tax=Dermatophilus congolensis TaxID=1863 RepID=A0A239V3L2_9MICO|nr:carbohydrate kinase [Dermatophilus congolensis]MBO3130140.1 carbohydrate kinase [Dermatophilus congolensis]MBO3131233.1 carbohydrate kinase [Dermatophilus congolensis]MBO3134611.1 carbohydrate kinase [Dermatophilus congolensis]MBO3136848.1 carbohydrate kinase [Dermatophilus congolensis]MBO3139092.1 carbohydrate kinase [Dermatophilus congolensis]